MRPLKTQPVCALSSYPRLHTEVYQEHRPPQRLGSGRSVPRPATDPPLTVPPLPGCWWLSGKAGGRSNAPAPQGLALPIRKTSRGTGMR